MTYFSIISVPFVTPTKTTTYQLTYTDLITGCENNEWVVVSVVGKSIISDVTTAPTCAPAANQDLTSLIPGYGSYINPVWYQNTIPGGTVVADPTSITLMETTDFFLVAENNFGCADTAQVTINVENPKTPAIASSTSASCPSYLIDLADYQGSPSDPSYTLEWHSDNTTNPSTLISNTQVGAGTYYLFEISPNGCTSASDLLIVSLFNSQLTADASYSTFNSGKAIQLESSATGGTGVYQFSWDELGTSDAYIVTPSIPTTFTLRVTDGSGCTDTDQVTVVLPREKCSCD